MSAGRMSPAAPSSPPGRSASASITLARMIESAQSDLGPSTDLRNGRRSGSAAILSEATDAASETICSHSEPFCLRPRIERAPPPPRLDGASPPPKLRADGALALAAAAQPAGFGPAPPPPPGAPPPGAPPGGASGGRFGGRFGGALVSPSSPQLALLLPMPTMLPPLPLLLLLLLPAPPLHALLAAGGGARAPSALRCTAGIVEDGGRGSGMRAAWSGTQGASSSGRMIWP